MVEKAAIKWLEVEIKRILHETHTDDLKSTIKVNSRVTALEMAIEALEQNEKLKAVIKGWYGQNGIVPVDEEVNAVSCKHCTRRIDGKCPLDDSEECPQSDEEAIELFFKYGLE